MLIYEWPAVLQITGRPWKMDARTRSGGETVTGRGLSVSSGYGLWRATIIAPIRTRAQQLAARALEVQLGGTAHAVMVGPHDCVNAPRVSPVVLDIPHSDGTLHSDDTGYSQGGVPPKVLEDAAVGDVGIIVATGSALRLDPGAYIGLGAGNGRRLYRIASISAGPSADTLSLIVWPPLRAAVSAGAAIELSAPVAPMRQVTDDAFELDIGPEQRLGTLTIEMVEVTNGLPS